MKPGIKLLLVQLIVLAGFSLFLVAWKIYSSHQYQLFLKASQLHYEELIDQVTNRHTSQYIRPLRDNSEWDETVQFIEKPDPEFEKVNLQTILPLYSINSILVYNSIGKQISAVSDSQSRNMEQLLDPYDVSRILSKKNPKCHFFLKSGNEMFEVFGATVVTTYDTAHLTTPRGFLFFLIKWDTEILNMFSTMTFSKVQLNLGSYRMVPDEADETLEVFRHLSDWQGNVVGELLFIKTDPLINEWNASSVQLLFFIILFGLFFIGLSGLLFYKTISRPLLATIEKLHAIENRNALFLLHLPTGLLVHSTDTRVTFINLNAAQLFGSGVEEMMGKDDSDPVWRFTDEDGNFLTKELYPVNRVLMTIKPLNDKLYGIRKRGSTAPVWVLVNAYPEVDSRGQVLHVLVNILDISDRRHAEEEIRNLNRSLEVRVKERTTRLESVISELESFSYSVSHDLMAPLRVIDNFARIIFEDHAESLTPEVKKIVQIVISSAQNMDQLIKDLLDFSKLNRQEVHPVKFSMEKMVSMVISEMVLGSMADRIKFNIGKIPDTCGDPAMIRQVWRNLIGNAIKFSSSRPTPEIEIGSKLNGNEVIYYIRDNGVGFNMAYVGKIFGVFQRLHSAREFEGSGVGLAIVQQVIHRHGGRIWAEGKVGEGAVFYFSLPAPSS